MKVLSDLDFFEDSVKTMAQNRFFEHTEHFCEDINNVNGKTFSDIIKKNNPEKQIVYGEYVETCQKIQGDKIYNAFIMPYDFGDEKIPYKFVSVGTANWKPYSDMSANYNYVLGILVDTRYLIEQSSKHNIIEIEKLSDLIVSSLTIYRSENNK